MDYVDELIDVIKNVSLSTRKKYHLKLGELVDFLEESGDLITIYHKPHVYRGYYSDLALEVCDGKKPASILLRELKQILNKKSEFVMSEDTPLWISDCGKVSGLAIIGKEIIDNTLIFITKQT